MVPLMSADRPTAIATQQTRDGAGIGLSPRPAEYRLIRPEEEAAAMDLWAAAFTWIERPRLEAEFAHGDPQRLAHTRVAAAPDGTLLAAVTYCLRDIRDESGIPRRVGCVVNVATHPLARRQGHARRLLAQSVAAMRAEGCAWALLYTTEEGRPLYEREGWRAFPQPHHRGIACAAPGATTAYAVRPFDPECMPGGWAVLADLYAAYNARRPLTTLRDAAYWRGYAALRFAGWPPGHRAVVLVATPIVGSEPCGYVLAYVATAAQRRRSGTDDVAFTLAELAVRPGHEAAIPALLRGVVRQAGPGRVAGCVHAPQDPALDTALAALFGPERTMVCDTRPMALPIDPTWDAGALDRAFGAAGAMLWPVDEL
jgi:GNAT superfamily N-acetyltransferase